MTLTLTGSTLYFAYETRVADRREQLRDELHSYSALVQEIFEETQDSHLTLELLEGGQQRLNRIKPLGEIVIARKRGNKIQFLLMKRGHRLSIQTLPSSEGSYAEPTIRALNKSEGTIIARDYAGREVLAAYRYIPELDWGIVAKVDMNEVRDPFIRFAIGIGIILVVMLVLGFILVLFFGNKTVSSFEADQANLMAQVEKAEGVNRVNSSFFANMSHDLRSPLSAILGYADILGEKQIPEAQRREYLDSITRNGKRLLKLLEDLLQVTRNELKAGSTSLEPLSLTGFVKALEEDLHSLTAKKNLEGKIEKIGFLPETVLTDEIQLRRILDNLIGNAVKHTSKGGVEVKVWADAERNRLWFEVSDTGCGIPLHCAECIFKPFNQGKSTQVAGGGVGLGLSIAKTLAKNLGGDVELRESTPQKGSRFVLWIPFGERESRLSKVKVITR